MVISQPLVASDRMKAGRVCLAPGEAVGEHVTERREEIIVVLRGTAQITEENAVIEKKAGESHHIKEGMCHNVKNDTDGDLEYIYITAN